MKSFSVPAEGLRVWLNKFSPTDFPCQDNDRNCPVCPVEGYMMDRFPGRKVASCRHSTMLYNPDLEYVHPKWLSNFIKEVDSIETPWESTTAKVFLAALDKHDETPARVRS